MSLNFYPPTIYFNDINFNNDFYAIPNNNQGISLSYANNHFLFSTGVANSTATSTFFSGSVGVGAIASGLSGDMNALKYLLNGNNISNIFVSSNVLSNTSNTLNTKIDTKEDKLIFNTPFSRVNNTISLLFDASLSLDGTGKLSVVSSGTGIGTSSQWTSSATNIFNNNLGNVGIGSQIPAYKLDVLGDINCSRYLLNGNNISNIFVSSNVLSNINLNQGFINSNITNEQFIPSLKTSGLNLNQGNISSLNNINGESNINFYNNGCNSLSLTSNYSSCNYDLIAYGKIKENNLYLSYVYASSNSVAPIIINDTPQVNKKKAFYCYTTNIIYPNGLTPYYAYHIYLNDYTKVGFIDIGSASGDTYRIFKIKAFFGSSYFEKLTNGISNIVSYEIYMSIKSIAVGLDTKAGINIYAIGEPKNPFLDNIINNDLFILRNITNAFNYLSIITKTNADVRVIIEDMLW